MLDLTWIEVIYWGSTVIGGTLFLLRTILFLVGGGVDHDGMDADLSGEMADGHDIHYDPEHTEGLGGDTDFSFKILSMQGLTAFFTMFGLIGLALLRARLPIILTIFGGTGAGLFAVLIISVIFSQVKHLQSDGSLQINNAIGQKGTVYLAIPKGGSGQIQLPVQGTLRIFDAVAEDNKGIGTGEGVEVISIADNKTLIVKKL